ncbi:TetR family transcriptional regulator [Cellulomonas sp. NPDC058312]|uniref:TetR family transcriptional regulator n=1 Tax=Cellulomonas sp. NPDC058312 TaxID=3346441 RepID=UPI0036EB52D3
MRDQDETAAPRRRGRPRADEVAARREAVLDVAVTLFGERGFAATTVEAVAAAAGVSKRTVYTWFTDKTGLLLAAVDRLHAHERAPDPGEADLESVAARIVHTLHGDDAVTLHRLVTAEAPQLPGLAATFYAQGPAASIAALGELLAGRVDDPARSAPELYTLLLGEPHRRRLLGLASAPTPDAAREHALRAVRVVLGG